MPKGKQIKLSIIIVYYGEKKSLSGLLRSIQKNRPKFNLEIIVVNNKAGENIKAYFKKYNFVKSIIESGKNLGYGRGNNLGAKSAKGEYLFIINTDIEVIAKSIDILVSFLDGHVDTAIVAPNLQYPNGNLLENIGSRTLTPLRGIFALSFINKIFPNNSISKCYFLKDISKNKLREVDTVPGTAFLIRKSVFDNVGGFDNNFFLYFEEFDLCKRVRDLGWKIIIDPKAVVVHYWEPGDGGLKLKKYFEQSRFYYFKKHFGLISALIVEFFTRISRRLVFVLVISTVVIIILALK